MKRLLLAFLLGYGARILHDFLLALSTQQIEERRDAIEHELVSYGPPPIAGFVREQRRSEIPAPDYRRFDEQPSRSFVERMIREDQAGPIERRLREAQKRLIEDDARHPRPNGLMLDEYHRQTALDGLRREGRPR